MPKDESRYPGKFPAWMQLCYAKALKTPGEWVDCIVCYSDAGAISEARGFRAFRRSVRDPRWEIWAKTISEDAQEYVSRSRVKVEQVIEYNWPKTKRTIQVIVFKGDPPGKLKSERAEYLRNVGMTVLKLGDDALPPESGK